MYQNAKVSSNRIIEYIENLEYDSPDSINKEYISNINGIEVKDLNFSYDTDPLISHINFSFKRSNIYAITGDNGKGKSTFMDILMGIIASHGEILFDGVNIRDIDLQKLREENISIVEQQPVIIQDTLYNNLILNNKAIDNKKLLSLLNEFKIEYPLNTPIGNNLSGGEKQKINIIRCLIKNSQLLIMDEPTTALDAQSKHVFYDIIQKQKNGKIVIIITHDLDLLCIADHVLKF